MAQARLKSASRQIADCQDARGAQGGRASLRQMQGARLRPSACQIDATGPRIELEMLLPRADTRPMETATPRSPVRPSAQALAPIPQDAYIGGMEALGLAQDVTGTSIGMQQQPVPQASAHGHPRRLARERSGGAGTSGHATGLASLTRLTRPIRLPSLASLVCVARASPDAARGQPGDPNPATCSSPCTTLPYLQLDQHNP